MKRKGIEAWESELSMLPEGLERSRRDREEIQRLQTALEQVSHANGKVSTVEFPIADNTFTFGLFGDTQIGSSYAQLGYLETYYKICKDAGVSAMLHTGDVLDGHKVYKGQEFDQSEMGWDKQSTRFQNDFPSIEGVNTYFITGNHDQSFTNLTGIKVGIDLELKRPDVKCIGHESAQIIFKTPSGRKLIVGLRHPGGGTAYAISYKMQKIIGSLEGGSKPHILGMGHYHKAEMLPNYRNLCGIQTGCFQRQTPFMERLGTPAHMGGWIIKFTVGKQITMMNAISTQFISFY